MPNEKEVILTLDGLAKLEKELEHLKTVRRREVAERIKQSLEFGDISENSEYEDAKNEQGFIEGRILAIEKMLRNAKVIDEQEVPPYQPVYVFPDAPFQGFLDPHLRVLNAYLVHQVRESPKVSSTAITPRLVNGIRQ